MTKPIVPVLLFATAKSCGQGTITFDGTTAAFSREPRLRGAVTGAELGIFLSKSFANWSAVFFVFFPERRHGSLDVNADGTIAFTPVGGAVIQFTKTVFDAPVDPSLFRP